MEPVYAAPALSRLLDHCANAVAAVEDGRSLNDVLPAVEAEVRPGVQALVFHVMRWWGSARTARALLAPRTPPPRVDSLLTSALALLWPAGHPPYPDHTLVDEAVTAARLRTPAAAGFVNAVLRRFIRERDRLVLHVGQDVSGAWNHPPWWVDRLRQDWPTHWRALLEQANRHPPMTLRVNARQGSAGDYVRRLAAQGLKAWAPREPALGGQAVVLERPCPVSALPGFSRGEVSVQDAAAQRAAPLLLADVPPARPDAAGALPPRPLAPGARVLDACAAPGGKTAHLLERADLDVVALDKDARRLTRVADTLRRLRLNARLVHADAAQPRQWWDGQPFDAILLDAPCSASGIVSRHPEVRWLRRAQDLGSLAQEQTALLQAVWPLLKPGGRLLYATCSIFKAEGQAVVDAFLQRLGPGKALQDCGSPGHLLPLDHNAQELPGRDPAVVHDGFFYALIHKPA